MVAWDTEPWHANAEFFADFGDYTLALTVPSDYVDRRLWRPRGHGRATGRHQHIRYRAESVSDVAWTAWPGYRQATRGGRRRPASPVELELLAPRSLSLAAR